MCAGACVATNPARTSSRAAINAVHAESESAADTAWPQILALYDELLAVAPTPVVALNRAIAVGEVAGPAAALNLIDKLNLANYYLFHATRADLLRRLDGSAKPAMSTGWPRRSRRPQPSATSSTGRARQVMNDDRDTSVSPDVPAASETYKESRLA